MSENAVVNIAQPESPAPSTPMVTPEVPSAAPASKPDEMSAKFAALAKKERMARMIHSQAKQKEADLLAREKAIAEREKLWEEEFKQSPLKALKKRGYTYQDITQAALNDDKFEPATEIKSVKEEIERLRQEQADKEAKALEQSKKAQAEAEAQVVEQFKERIGDHIEKNVEKYELTKLYDASELVFQTVEEHYSRTQKVLSIDEACGLVEQYLESELERTAKESKKFKSKFMQAKQEEKQLPPKSSTTLTNSMDSSASAPSLLSPKNEEDRMRRALAALG